MRSFAVIPSTHLSSDSEASLFGRRLVASRRATDGVPSFHSVRWRPSSLCCTLDRQSFQISLWRMIRVWSAACLFWWSVGPDWMTAGLFPPGILWRHLINHPQWSPNRLQRLLFVRSLTLQARRLLYSKVNRFSLPFLLRNLSERPEVLQP